MDFRFPKGKEFPDKKPQASLLSHHTASKWQRLQNGSLNNEDIKEQVEQKHAAHQYLLRNNLYVYLTETKQLDLIKRLYLKKKKRRFSRKLLARLCKKRKNSCKKLAPILKPIQNTSQVCEDYKKQLHAFKMQHSLNTLSTNASHHGFFHKAITTDNDAIQLSDASQDELIRLLEKLAFIKMDNNNSQSANPIAITEEYVRRLINGKAKADDLIILCSQLETLSEDFKSLDDAFIHLQSQALQIEPPNSIGPK